MAEAATLHRRLYAPLPPNHIRLIEIENETAWDLPLVCSMHTVSLDEMPSHLNTYTALSYVWDSRKMSRKIICDGHHRSITTNLYDALWSVKDKPVSSSRRLWVDALCINQNDDDEKSQQVALMGKIYKSAEMVLVWLGSASSVPGDKVDKLYDALKESDSSMVDIKLLTDASWFGRIWTLQEIVLARKACVRLGPICVEWDKLVTIHGYDHPTDRIARIEAIRRSEHNGLHQLISASADRSCSNPLDRIYGLLGMWHDQTSIQPDYKAKSLHEVYAQAIVALCKEQAGLPRYCMSHIQQIIAQDPSPLWRRSICLATRTSWISKNLNPLPGLPQAVKWWQTTVNASTSCFPTANLDFSLVGVNLKARSLLIGSLAMTSSTTEEPDTFNVEMEGAIPFPECSNEIIPSIGQPDTTSNHKIDGNLQNKEAQYSVFLLYRALLLHKKRLCACRQPMESNSTTSQPMLWLTIVHGYPYTLVVRPLVDFATQIVKFELIAQFDHDDHLWTKCSKSGLYKSGLVTRWQDLDPRRFRMNILSRSSLPIAASVTSQNPKGYLPTTMEICGDPIDIQRRLDNMAQPMYQTSEVV